jgi:hypothetical protein
MYRSLYCHQCTRIHSHMHGRGTPRYASGYVHKAMDLGRRDDLWSLFFLLVEMTGGSLPWAGKTDRALVGRLKDKYTQVEAFVEELLHDCPTSLHCMLEHLNTLEFADKPDYQFLVELFEEDFFALQLPMKHPYDWEHHPTTTESATANTMRSKEDARSHDSVNVTTDDVKSFKEPAAQFHPSNNAQYTRGGGVGVKTTTNIIRTRKRSEKSAETVEAESYNSNTHLSVGSVSVVGDSNMRGMSAKLSGFPMEVMPKVEERKDEHSLSREEKHPGPEDVEAEASRIAHRRVSLDRVQSMEAREAMLRAMEEMDTPSSVTDTDTETDGDSIGQRASDIRGPGPKEMMRRSSVCMEIEDDKEWSQYTARARPFVHKDQVNSSDNEEGRERDRHTPLDRKHATPGRPWHLSVQDESVLGDPGGGKFDDQGFRVMQMKRLPKRPPGASPPSRKHFRRYSYRGKPVHPNKK